MTKKYSKKKKSIGIKTMLDLTDNKRELLNFIKSNIKVSCSSNKNDIKLLSRPKWLKQK